MNKTEKPKTNTSRGKTWRCLQALLKGKVVNRKTLGTLGIASNNDSAHSLISTIQNQMYVPVERQRTEDGTCDYFMDEREIKRFQNPVLRQQQQEEMQEFVLTRRKRKAQLLTERVRTNTPSSNRKLY